MNKGLINKYVFYVHLRAYPDASELVSCLLRAVHQGRGNDLLAPHGPSWAPGCLKNLSALGASALGVRLSVFGRIVHANFSLTKRYQPMWLG